MSDTLLVMDIHFEITLVNNCSYIIFDHKIQRKKKQSKVSILFCYNDPNKISKYNELKSIFFFF